MCHEYSFEKRKLMEELEKGKEKVDDLIRRVVSTLPIRKFRHSSDTPEKADKVVT